MNTNQPRYTAMVHHNNGRKFPLKGHTETQINARVHTAKYQYGSANIFRIIGRDNETNTVLEWEV